MRDYRAHLLTIAKRSPATINNTLAALDDFYTRRGEPVHPYATLLASTGPTCGTQPTDPQTAGGYARTSPPSGYTSTAKTSTNSATASPANPTPSR